MKGLIKDIVALTGVRSVYSIGNRPKYPFATYQILNADTKNNHNVLVTEENKQRLERQPQAILSIQAYGKTMIQAMEEAERLYDFFLFQYENSDYVVVEVSDIQDRTVLNINQYDYAFGFDVWIRLSKNIERDRINIENIGEVDLDYGDL